MTATNDHPLLRALHELERTGTHAEVSVDSGGKRARVLVASGEVAWVHVGAPGMALATYLKRESVVPPEQLKRVAQHCRKERLAPTQVLVDWKLLTPEQLRTCLLGHFKRCLSVLLEWESPTVEVAPKEKAFATEHLYRVAEVAGRPALDPDDALGAAILAEELGGGSSHSTGPGEFFDDDRTVAAPPAEALLRNLREPPPVPVPTDPFIPADDDDDDYDLEDAEVVTMVATAEEVRELLGPSAEELFGASEAPPAGPWESSESDLDSGPGFDSDLGFDADSSINTDSHLDFRDDDDEGGDLGRELYDATPPPFPGRVNEDAPPAPRGLLATLLALPRPLLYGGGAAAALLIVTGITCVALSDGEETAAEGTEAAAAAAPDSTSGPSASATPTAGADAPSEPGDRPEPDVPPDPGAPAGEVVLVDAGLDSDLVGRVVVGSEPEGARIYLDGINTGRFTPATLTQVGADRPHAVLVTNERGSQRAHATVRVREGEAAVIDLTLVTPDPDAPDRLPVALVSKPPGASVRVDGVRQAGVTPLTVELPSDAPARIELRRRGYRTWVRTIHAIPDVELTVHAEMRRRR